MIVKPMTCIMPRPEDMEKVASLPYDVYSRAEARAIVRKNPEAYLSIERPDANFDDETDSYADCVYEKAAALLQSRVASGAYRIIDEAAYYLYRQEKGDHVQTGIVAKCALADYLNGTIKKHELTREDKEADRVRNIIETGAQTGVLFLAFRNDSAVCDIIDRNLDQAPLVTFTAADGVRQSVYQVAKSDEAALEAAFAAMDALYIADGHHRARAAATVYERKLAGELPFGEEADYVLAAIFPERDLAIMDYNRVVRDLNGLTTSQFLAALSTKGALTPWDGVYKPDAKGHFGVYLEGRWYKLSLKPAADADVVRSLDCAVLQEKVLSPILGIGNPRTDKRIDFIGGIRGLKEIERRCGADMVVGFAVFPTAMAELFAVADENLLMPPKSTWFEPKLQSG
ncbi:MAG: DUF1015 family protein, partial [Eubacteriales bacterium]|nr:DUF1015 family protein [Eubacteriales bacterium]